MTDNLKTTKAYRFWVMGILLLGCVGLEFYFHTVHGITVVYTHLFYIPIVVAAFWWGLKAGFPVSLFLALMHIALSFPVIEEVVLFRSLIFVLISSVIGIIGDMHRRAETELKESEQLLKDLFDSVQDGISVLDTDLTIRHVNGVIKQWYAETLPLEGRKCYEAYQNADKPCDPCPSLRCIKSGKTELDVVPGPPGSPVEWIELFSYPLKDSGEVTGVAEFVRDVTARKQAEEKIKHLNLVLSAIRNVNQLVVTEKDRDCLIQRACDNLTETRGYYSAWIVLLDDAGKYVISAESGLGKDFLPIIEMLKRGEFTACGKNAFSQAGVVVTEDPASTCTDCLLSEKYAGRSAMTICLKHGGKIYGLLSISNSEKFVLNEEEQGLFKEVAGDIAFALHRIEMEAERELIGEALRESEERFRSLTESTPSAVMLYQNNKWVYVNPAAETLTGYSQEELLSMDFWDVVHSDFKQLIKDRGLARQKGVPAEKRYEFKIVSKDGQEKWVDLAGATAMFGGKPAGLITVTDITGRKLAEERIKRSLREKEILLAEIHHRVKNNMQIISSLLSLQSRDIKDKRALSLIKNCEHRIKAMSLVHEKLYLSDDLSRIDFHDYVESLSARFFQVHRVDSRIVSFSSHVKNVSFSIETAMPLGLIINELVSNAMKHAFPEGRKGNIAVKLTQNTKADEYTLTVTDDGIGFPEGIDYRNTETFGLQLVDMLTEQLGGTIEFDGSEGTSFKIIFKEQKYRKRVLGSSLHNSVR